MRPESAPQYALGKKALSFYAAKMSGKTSAAPTIISFFRCERKTSKYYYYHRNKEKSGLIRKLNSKKKMPTQHCISLRIRADYQGLRSCALS